MVACVPSHCGIVGNELVDEATNRAATWDQEEVRCNFEGMRRRLFNIGWREEWENERCRKVYGETRLKRKVEDKWSKEDAVSMARLRSGHSLELLAYKKRIGMEKEERCKRCEMEEEDLEHVVDCPAGERRTRMLRIWEIGNLVKEPEVSLAYWKW